MTVDNAALESICMKIISQAGEGRGKVFEAIDALLDDEIDKAKELVKTADDLLLEAHKLQFNELIKRQAQGEEVPFNVLLIHAMDLLMITMSERDLIKKILAKKNREK